MEEILAVLAVAAGLGAAGTITAAAYQVARHFGRLNREAHARLAPPPADAGTVTRSELEAMIRDAVRESPPVRNDDLLHIPQGRPENAPRVR